MSISGFSFRQHHAAASTLSSVEWFDSQSSLRSRSIGGRSPCSQQHAVYSFADENIVISFKRHYKLYVMSKRAAICIGVNHGDGECMPPKFTMGDGYITIPPIRMVNWTAVRPPTQIAPAYSESIGLVTVDSTSSSFTSISKISFSLGLGGGFVH